MISYFWRSSILSISVLVFFSISSPAQSWKELYDQATQQYNAQDYEQAFETSEYALSRASETFGEGSEYHLATLRLLVFITFSSENYQKGVAFAQKEIDLRRKDIAQGNVVELGKAFYFSSLLHLNLDAIEKAKEQLIEAQSIFEKTEQTSSLEYGRVLYNLALIAYQKGDMEEGYELVKPVPGIFLLHMDEEEYELAGAYKLYGSLAFGRSDYKQSVEALKKAKHIYALYPDDEEDFLEVSFDLAINFVALENFPEAFSLLESVKEYKTNIAIFSQEDINDYNYQLGLSAYKTNRNGIAQTSLEQVIASCGNISESSISLCRNAASLLAVVYQNKGESKKAQDLLSQLGDAENGSADGLSRANALNNLASIELNKGQIAQAEDLYRKALAVLIEEGSPSEQLYGILLENLGAVQRSKGKLQSADSFYTAAYSFFVQNFGEQNQRLGQIQLQQAYLAIALGKYELAYELMQKAEAAIKSAKGEESNEFAALLNAKASMLQNQGKYEEAEQAYKQSLIIRAKVVGENTNEFATVLNNLATLYQTRGWYGQAREYLERSLIIKAKLFGDRHSEYAGAIENLALLYMNLGNQEKALNYLEQALDIYRKSFGEGHPKYGNALLNLARLELAKGNYAKAEPLLQQALKILRQQEGESSLNFAIAINSLAVMYQTMGNFNAAEPLYKQSIGIYENLYGKMHPEYSTSLENLAALYEQMGSPQKAMPLMKEALKIDMKVLGPDHPSTATTIQNLASLFQMYGKQEEALGLYEQALEITRLTYGREHPSFANTLFNLAVLRQRLGQLAEAEQLFLQALEIREKVLGRQHPDYAFSQYGLAVLYQITEREQKAKPLFEELIKHYLNQVEKVFPSLSEKEKSAFYAKIFPVISAFQDFAIEYAPKDKDQNNHVLQQLYDVQLATKALLLNASNKVKNNIMSSGDAGLIALYEDWIAQKEELAKLYAFSTRELEQQGVNIGNLESKANETEKLLSSRSQVFSAEYESTKVDWKAVRGALKAGEMAIEIIRIRKNLANDSIVYAVLMLRHDAERPQLVVLQNGKDLDDRSFRYYKNAIRYQIKDERSFGYYWKDIAPHLEGIKKIYLSADGIYNKVSLPTLWNPESGQYLIDKYDFYLLSNTRELLDDTHRDKHLTSKDVVLLGFPDYNSLFEKGNQLEDLFGALVTENKGKDLAINDETFRGGISYLPGTKVEIEVLSRLFSGKGWNIQSFLYQKAKEEKIKELKGPRVLHIATHGYFLNDLENTEHGKAFGIHMNNANNNPLLRSGLLLAGSGSTMSRLEEGSFTVALEDALEDGVLTAYEAMNLQLDNTELVVLSACETGLGEVKNGEGVYGLQRAFQVAGAENIMMSLWKVNDATTQELMTLFYESWLGGKEKLEAFREARQQLKEKYAHPYFWGAFVMIGN